VIARDELKRLFSYDPGTGLFVRLVRSAMRAKAGEIAGAKNDKGYIAIKINRKSYKAHRLAWLYVYGVWPKDQIDHINHNKSDNRIANLREATNSENQKNRFLAKNNTSGMVGVSLVRHTGKWQARISVDGHRINLGCFENKLDAVSAREAAHIKYGFHENHGKQEKRNE